MSASRPTRSSASAASSGAPSSKSTAIAAASASVAAAPFLSPAITRSERMVQESDLPPAPSRSRPAPSTPLSSRPPSAPHQSPSSIAALHTTTPAAPVTASPAKSKPASQFHLAAIAMKKKGPLKPAAPKHYAYGTCVECGCPIRLKTGICVNPECTLYKVKVETEEPRAPSPVSIPQRRLTRRQQPESEEEQEEEEEEEEEEDEEEEEEQKDGAEGEAAPPKRGRGRPPGKYGPYKKRTADLLLSGSSAGSGNRHRAARPKSLIDLEAYADDANDEDYRGSSKRNLQQRFAVSMSSYGSGGASDLKRALALSMANAGAGGAAMMDSLEDVDIWDERPDDPRHANSKISGIYIVNQPRVVPRGFTNRREPIDEKKLEFEDELKRAQILAHITEAKEKAAAAASAPLAAAVSRGRKSTAATTPIVPTPSIAQDSTSASPLSPSPTSSPSTLNIPKPVLLRSGFVSTTATESVSSTWRRAASFESIWTHTDNVIRRFMQTNETSVYTRIQEFATTAFTDFPADAKQSSAQTSTTTNTNAGGQFLFAKPTQVATNVFTQHISTPPPFSQANPNWTGATQAAAAAASLLPTVQVPRSTFYSHPIPVALVHAGMNIDDHALLMSGLKDRIRLNENASMLREVEQNKRRKLEAITAEMEAAATAAAKAEEEARVKAALAAEAARVKAETAGDDSGSGEEDEDEEMPPVTADKPPPKKRGRKRKIVEVHPSEYYQKLGEAARADLDPNDPLHAHADASVAYPVPAPMAILLPSNPPNLLSLLRSIYVSLADDYPSPKALSAHPRSEMSLISQRKVEKSGPNGGLVFVVGKLAEWAAEHRRAAETRYERWHKTRTQAMNKAQQAASETNSSGNESATAAPMDVETEAAAASASDKSRANGKQNSPAPTQGGNGNITKPSSSAFSLSLPAAPPAPQDAPKPLAVRVSANPSAPAYQPVVFPSFIYPKLLLLFPSFDRFPPALMQEFLELLVSHPLLRHYDTHFPWVMVWPVAGVGGAGNGISERIHSSLTRNIIQRLWFESFELSSPSLIMSQLLHHCFHPQLNPSQLKSTLDHGGMLPLPFHLGSEAMGFLLRQFYGSHTSISVFMRTLRYMLLDQIDAEGPRYYARKRESVVKVEDKIAPTTAGALTTFASTATGSSSEFRFINSGLCGTFMRACVRSLRRSARNLVRVGVVEYKKLGYKPSTVAREDPIDEWIRELSHTELNHLRTFSSLRSVNEELLLVPDETLRSQIKEWITDLMAHRLNFARVCNIIYEAIAHVGYYNQAGVKKSPTSDAQFGMNQETELWLHLLSNPLFGAASADPASPLVLHASSRDTYPRLDHVFNCFERPDSLRELVAKLLKTTVEELEACVVEEEMSELLTREGRMQKKWITKALEKFKQQESLFAQNVDSTSTTTTAATATNVTPTTAVVKAPAVANRYNRHALVTQTANDSRARNRLTTATLLSFFRRFVEEMAAPLHSLPLAELICYENGQKAKYLFQAQPEPAIHTALTQSEYYLTQSGIGMADESAVSSAAPLNLMVPPPPTDTDSLSFASPLLRASACEDIVVAFHIFSSMSGQLVNLADWFDAFKRNMRSKSGVSATPAVKQEEEEEKQGTKSGKKRGVVGARKTRVAHSAEPAAASAAASSSSSPAAAASSMEELSDASLQVRFLTCLSTLANLGYLKATKRRVDHVIKLQMNSVR